MSRPIDMALVAPLEANLQCLFEMSDGPSSVAAAEVAFAQRLGDHIAIDGGIVVEPAREHFGGVECGVGAMGLK